MLQWQMEYVQEHKEDVLTLALPNALISALGIEE